ncbi:WD40-repeat-containing domain protein [Suillus subalutaceus]|uniref:WD40-repeat-containing domain protein n=1 Tax=Suillus subalutaceus TaxID=48586 RepID=UPI001B863FF2|nr:WD40-repeat-containing domain protein [Suillus subalutaceus]KAG1849188.1 WD40-repeat-containing domain protein [Suillus subalutaceus]
MTSTESSAKPTLEEASIPVQSRRPTPKHNFEGHEKEIWGFVFLHDNVHIVSGSVDGTMHKWNCDTGLTVGEPWKGEGGGIYPLALSPDGKIIACGREDGSVQRWTTDGEMMEGIWTGQSKAVWSFSWSPSGSHIASGSEDGTILIRRAESGKVVVGPIKTKQEGVEALAYSPSGDRIASGGFNTICVWDTKTGQPVVGPISLGLSVTSLVWSSDSTKLYSASDKFARVFDSKSGKLLHRFKHDHVLYSIALSPKHNVLACVGHQGVAQLWDTESHQRLGQPFHQIYDTLYYVSFSRDGRYVAYGGDNKKLTLWVLKDMAPQLPAPTPVQQRDSQSTQQETRSNSSSLSCLDADATGGDGFIDGVHDDLYDNFFQSSQQSLPSPSPSPGYRLPPWLSVRCLWNVVSRHRPPPDESIPQERSRRKFFARRARSGSPLEHTTIKSNQPVPEEKVREGEGEQGVDVDDRGSRNDPLSARKDKGKQQDDAPADAQSLPSDDRAPPAPLVSQNNRNFWERLIHPRGKFFTFGLPYPQLENTPQRRIPHDPWRWNFSLIPAGSSRCSDDIAACRDEDRYGITPETDEEAAAAMLRNNDDVADSSTRPGRRAVVAQPTQIQDSTSGSDEIVVSCCGFVISRRCCSNSHQP